MGDPLDTRNIVSPGWVPFEGYPMTMFIQYIADEDDGVFPLIFDEIDASNEGYTDESTLESSAKDTNNTSLNDSLDSDGSYPWYVNGCPTSESMFFKHLQATGHTVMSTEVGDTVELQDFLLDSGASCHVVNDLSHLFDIVSTKASVTVGSGATVFAYKQGKLLLRANNVILRYC